ncbi:MAG: outer membrane beta-barrel protein [Alteraurantiacibacter sp.]
MTKGFALILGSVSLAALAAPAAAQDAANFEGLHVEALVGYDMMRPGSTTDIDNNEDVDQTIEDVAYGVGAGYDVAMGGVIIGAEAQYVQSEAGSEYDTTGVTGFGVSNVEVGRDLYFGARVGFPVTENTLVYGKGGYTNTNLNVISSDNTTDTETNVDLDGWRVGAGVEQAISPGVFAKVEYAYSNYQEGEFEAPSGLESDRFGVDLDRHQVMVGVGARF